MRPDRRLVAALLVVSVVSSMIFIVLLVADKPTLDLGVYVLGARHLFDGRLYVVRGTAWPYLDFTYPPFAALAFTPIAWLPFGVDQLVWSAISLASLVGLLAASLWAARPKLTRTTLLVTSLLVLGPVMAFEPIYQNFHFLQVNLVLDLAIFCDLLIVLRVRGHVVPRGLLVGIAAAVKLTPLVFVGYLFVTRQFKAAWTALGAFAVCSIAGSLCDLHVARQFWTKDVTDTTRIGSVTTCRTRACARRSTASSARSCPCTWSRCSPASSSSRGSRSPAGPIDARRPSSPSSSPRRRGSWSRPSPGRTT